MNGHTNGHGLSGKKLSRAEEIDELLTAVQGQIIPWIKAADDNAPSSSSKSSKSKRSVLVDYKAPADLKALLQLRLEESGVGKDGVLDATQKILQYSVNTWDQGFMDKLYAATNGVGVVSELILAALNTNVHVYQVSPVLTLIEKHTTEALARLFGYTGPHCGGISQPGGSASNATSIIVARNTLHPRTKEHGLEGRRFVLFTSDHGHYSLEKAAQMQGFGSRAVRSVPVDKDGQMQVAELDRLIQASLEAGETPFYVNATAGTTVLGSFDPIDAIADVCQKYKLWLHVDGSWGAAVVFSEKLRETRLRGIERADSITYNPHKLLAVPVTCSFLLSKDMRQFWKATTLPAAYLFHSDAGAEPNPAEMYDLADLTPQCGRKGDSLKLYLSWVYHGTSGLRDLVERSFENATHMQRLVQESPNLTMVSPDPLPCTQVCFYYSPQGQLPEDQVKVGDVTKEIVRELVDEGFMIDFAPGPKGKMMRAVVGVYTKRETVEQLVICIERIGAGLL